MKCINSTCVGKHANDQNRARIFRNRKPEFDTVPTDSPVFYVQQINNFAAVGNITAAQKAFENAVERKKANPLTYAAMIRAYMNAGEVKFNGQTVVLVLEKTICEKIRTELDYCKFPCIGLELSAFFDLNPNWETEKRYKEPTITDIRRTFDQLIQKKPVDDQVLYVEMMRTYNNANQLHEAEGIFKTGLETLDSGDQHYLSIEMIMIYGERGKIGKAEGIFKQLNMQEYIGITPCAPKAYGAMIYAYLVAGDKRKALEMFIDAISKIGRMGSTIKANGVIDAPTCAFMILHAEDNADDINLVFRYATENKIANSLVYSAMIYRYGMLRDTRSARTFFDITENEKIADLLTYATIMDAYMRAGKRNEVKKILRKLESRNRHSNEMIIEERIEKAKEIFALAISTHHVIAPYRAMLVGYYEKKMFEDILELINRAPLEMREDEELKFMEIEALRKLRRYKEAILRINGVLNGLQQVPLPDDIIRARVIRAQCLFQLDGKHDEAKEEMRNLMQTVRLDNIHRARILCNMVFFNALEEGEKPGIEQELRKLERIILGTRQYSSILNDVSNALGQLQQARSLS